MKKQVMATMLTTAMIASMLVGCTSSETAETTTETVEETTETTTEEAPAEDAAASEEVYEDANGWSVKYDPSLFTVTNDGDVTSFAYTGESAGANVIIASYKAGEDAKTAADKLAAEYGDGASVTEAPFPNTEGVNGYWVQLPTSEEDGTGLYMTCVLRDYKDGVLSFELTGHNSGDDEKDMAVSDHMAMIIDSLTFAE
ncbi:MAG: hypothetical protein K6G07_02350 [Lachnospiraceae bacterium]|nr:hypothetical protein [Lachnospiraceae bacterium]